MPSGRLQLFFAAMIFVIVSARAQYTYHTMTDLPVGPGVRYYQILEDSQPWRIDVVEVDLTCPWVRLKSVKGCGLLNSPERPHSREPVSAMSQRLDYDGHRVTAAINGDFWHADGYPTNIQVENGELLTPPNHRSAIGFTPTNRPILARVELNARAFIKNATCRIHTVNTPMDSGALILYNHFYAPAAPGDSLAIQARLQSIDRWMVNDTVRCVVETVRAGTGTLYLSDGCVVLSGRQDAATFLRQNLSPGDTVKIFIGLNGVKERVKELLGGLPRIIEDGKVCIEAGVAAEGGAGIADVRHPRTAAGFNQDSTKLFLVVVDGRQPGWSSGMTFGELADFMLNLGVHQGLNLDGGGSSTMVVRDRVVNSPSDGRERPVANALLVISTAPAGEAKYLHVIPRRAHLLQGQRLPFYSVVTDSFYHTITSDPDHLQVHVPSRLGNMDSTLSFTATAERDSGFVSFHYHQLSDSCFLEISTLAELRIAPKEAVTDTIKSVLFHLQALDNQGRMVNPEVRWTTVPEDFGRVDKYGRFRANALGIGKVVAHALGRADTAYVTVTTGIPSLNNDEK
ncbi:phosphodiester glycosidase family protein [candidate division KSB1 bacterium]|nr:phosphodiester glycosidase family protein [candidate division KSB1 bacterium]